MLISNGFIEGDCATADAAIADAIRIAAQIRICAPRFPDWMDFGPGKIATGGGGREGGTWERIVVPHSIRHTVLAIVKHDLAAVGDERGHDRRADSIAERARAGRRVVAALVWMRGGVRRIDGDGDRRSG
jgi:hypothetical protein